MLTLLVSNRCTCNAFDLKLGFLQRKQIDQKIILVPPLEFEEESMAWK